MIGTEIGGYTVTDHIGSGGMAEVYTARDPELGREVAIKVLKDEYADDYEFRTRFEREGHAIAQLEHLHILPLYSVGNQEEMLYIVMRYMPYGSLAQLLEDGPVDLTYAAKAAKQIATALDYAHSNGIFHRDLKPGNVLLDQDRNVYLTDFGLAKWVGSSKTLTGEFIVGTPHYMAPEQCRGHEIVPATDQYSLGVVVFSMVTGQLLFDYEKPIYIMRDHVMADPPSPLDLRRDLPKEAEKIMLKALAKDPADRFPTCRAFASAFELSISGWRPSRFDRSSLPAHTRNRIHDALDRLGKSIGRFPPVEEE